MELKSGIIIQSSFSVSGTNCDKNWILFADSYSESEYGNNWLHDQDGITI